MSCDFVPHRHPREGGDPCTRQSLFLHEFGMPLRYSGWIPAFAGMTMKEQIEPLPRPETKRITHRALRYATAGRRTWGTRKLDLSTHPPAKQIESFLPEPTRHLR